MHTWFLSGLLLLFAAGCATLAPPAKTFSATPMTGATAAVLTVSGLSCPLCATSLEGQLHGIRGVGTVAIDLKTGHVRVTLLPWHAVSPALLQRAVEDAGFTVKQIQPETAGP